MAHLTRAEMEEVIRAGGSVLMNDHAGVGQIHSSVDTLPDEATLAVGNEKQENIVGDALDAQIASLLAQKKTIERARAERAKEEKANAKSAKGNEGGARHSGEDADSDPDALPDAGIGHGITELPPQGDRIGGAETEREHELASSGEGAETAEGEGGATTESESESHPPSEPAKHTHRGSGKNNG